MAPKDAAVAANQSLSSTRLHGSWRAVTRLAWLAFALLVTMLFVLGAQQIYREKSVLCTASSQDCQNNWLLTESDLQELGAPLRLLQAYARIDLVLKVFAALICTSIAGLIFWRRSDDWMALLVASWILLFPGSNGITTAAGRAAPGLAGLVFNLTSLYWIIQGLFLALFPNGRFVPRWAKGYLLVWASLFLLPPALQDKIPQVVTGLIFSSFFLFAVIAQVYRYRRVSTPLERQQTKWLVFGVGLSSGFAIVLGGIQLLFFPDLFEKTLRIVLINWILYLFLLLLPITVGLAILRYRLWDIDVIIRKTLVYAVVTILLALVYIGGVLLLQGLFAGLEVGKSPVAIGLSTLAIAALFNPVRRWVQEGVDRRFFRHKYDAERALNAFAVQTRDEVDIERLSAALVSALEETVQPVRVSLWLEAGGLQPANSPPPTSGEHQSTSRAGMLEMAIVPDEPLRAHLLKESGVIKIDALELDSAALRRLKEAGVKISVPLISQGELIGVLNLGPRRSEQGYSSDDGRLISNLATRAAPALRVAQLVHQQQIETRQRERIEQELRVARLVQETLLPKDVPSIPGWVLATHWQPAREMSGDFYDFLPFPDGRLGMIIGDVSGKGMPAALVMGIIQSILRATAERIIPPAEVLEQANKLLLPHIPANMFATCLYMILDPVTGCLQFANAGHNLPVLQTDRGLVEPRATGMPLGLLPGMTYDQNEVQLTPGHRLLMYTDGLVEAHNPQGEMFGTPYLHELVGQEIQVPPGSSGGAALIELLQASLADFTGSGWEQEDDVTLVTLDYLGPGWHVEDPAQTQTSAKGTYQILPDSKLSNRLGNER